MNQMQQHKIVILDNNRQRRDALKTMVVEWGHTPFIFEKEARCLDNLKPIDPDLVISGSLSSATAARFIHTLQLTNCGVPVLIISDDRDIREFVESNGFVDVSVLDVNSNPHEIKSTVDRILQDEAGRREYEAYCPLIIGGSPELSRIKKMISELNDVDEPVLIQGEPGTGKELLARFIHLTSKRQSKPLIKLNVPQLPADFFEKELLLLEDPLTKYEGIFLKAHEGTLLLEDIASMPLGPQATLLKMIDEIDSLNSAANHPDVRIIATAGRRLAPLAEAGQFRKELLYRLNVIRLEIPPLRGRSEDISALSDFFTDKICIESGRSHFELSNKMKNLFACYHWPGNIQELEDTIKHIIIDGAGDRIAKKLSMHKKYHTITDSYQDIRTLAGLSDVKKHLKDVDKISLKKIGGIFMERTEKKIIKKVLNITNWNRKRAAAMLNISYKSLLNKIKEYKLN